jgi:hypothetical protein
MGRNYGSQVNSISRFKATDIGGNNVVIGSIDALRSELSRLDQQTWQADSAQIRQWRTAGAEFGGPLEPSAQLALLYSSNLVMPQPCTICQ